MNSVQGRTLGIVVPVYNTEDDYLVRCLTSLTQEADDYAVAIVDDGSDAHTARLCKKWVLSHKDHFCYIQQDNSGQNSARNLGWRALDSSYTLFVDSDDILAEGSIGLLVRELKDERPDVLIFGFQTLKVNEALPKVFTYSSSISEPTKRELLAEQCSLWGLAIASPRIKATPLAEDLHMGEDFASVIPIIATSGRVLKSDMLLYGYTQRPTSATRSQEYKYPLEILKAFNRLEGFGFIDEYHDEIEWQAIKHLLFWEPMRLIDSGRHAETDKRVLHSYIRSHFPSWESNVYYRQKGRSYGVSFRLLTRGHWLAYELLSRIRGFCSGHG